MRHFNEMSTQQGFHQGTQIPHEAEIARSIYLQTLNHLLQKYNSKYRTLPSNPYEYGGHQNPYTWIRVTTEQYQQATTNDPHWYINGQHDPNQHTTETDPAWDDALQEAYDLDLDEYYEIHITTNKTKLHQLHQRIRKWCSWLGTPIAPKP